MEKTGCMVQCEKYTDADAFLKTEYSLVDKLRKYVTIRNMVREFLVVIAVVAKVLCKHGLWLVTCVKKRGTGSFRCPASVFKRAYTHIFFEDTTEIALLRIADSLTDLAYRQLRIVCQKLLGFLHTQVDNIFIR